MNPSSDSVTYSISPPSIQSVSARHPSISGNSEDVTKTDSALQVRPTEEVGLLVNAPPRVPSLPGTVVSRRVATGVGAVVVSPAVGMVLSHPQSTPKVVFDAASSEPSGNEPVQKQCMPLWRSILSCVPRRVKTAEGQHNQRRADTCGARKFVAVHFSPRLIPNVARCESLSRRSRGFLRLHAQV